jgi:phosphoserine phosphatase RsbU/P
MKTSAVLLFLSLGLSAQTISLDGSWKWHKGDDPRFSSANWDDSGWSLSSLPRQVQVPTGVEWFRKQAIAPSTSAPLALAIGSYNFCGEAFVNGVLVGRIPCQTGEDPPFFVPRVYDVPPGLVKPGEPFVVALRGEHRFALWGNASFLLDEGPYLLADRPFAEIATKAALGSLQRNASSFIVFAWTALGISCLLLVLWATNPSRRELLWFGLFQLCIFFFSGSQLLFVYEGAVSQLFFTWSIPAAFLFVTAAAHLVFFGVDMSVRWWVGVALLTLGSRIVLPGFAWQVPPLSLILVWALGRLRSPHLPDRLFAIAMLLYSILGMNSAISRTLPGLWPIPGAFWIGPFMIVTISATNGVLSSLMLVLLILRLGEDRREKQRLAGEMAAAAEMQSLLMPSEAIQGVEMVYLPATEVGGDFFQVVDRDDGTRVVVVGDVSGKGLRAAMLVSVAVGILRNEKSSSPAQILEVLNEGLIGRSGGGFVTCCCARFDAGGTVTIANAGHPSPYCDGQELSIEAGLPLGIVTGAEYGETVVRGEQFTFISDGVVEAENANRELFGFDRTQEISSKSAQEIAEAAKAWGQNDDITVVTIRRTS